MEIDIEEIFYQVSPQAEIDEKRRIEESRRKAVVMGPNGIPIVQKPKHRPIIMMPQPMRVDKK